MFNECVKMPTTSTMVRASGGLGGNSVAKSRVLNLASSIYLASCSGAWIVYVSDGSGVVAAPGIWGDSSASGRADLDRDGWIVFQVNAQLHAFNPRYVASWEIESSFRPPVPKGVTSFSAPELIPGYPRTVTRIAFADPVEDVFTNFYLVGNKTPFIRLKGRFEKPMNSDTPAPGVETLTLKKSR